MDQVELDTTPGSVETLLNSTLVLRFVNSAVPAKEGSCISRQTMKQSTTATWEGLAAERQIAAQNATSFAPL